MILEGSLLAEFRHKDSKSDKTVAFWVSPSSNLRRSQFVYRTFVLILIRIVGRIPSGTCSFAKDLQLVRHQSCSLTLDHIYPVPTEFSLLRVKTALYSVFNDVSTPLTGDIREFQEPAMAFRGHDCRGKRGLRTCESSLKLKRYETTTFADLARIDPTSRYCAIISAKSR